MLQLRSNPNFYSKQTYIFSFEILESIYKWKDCFNMIVFAHCDGSKEKRDEHKHSFLTKYYSKLSERFNEGFNKPAKHFKCTGEKASLKLWHIQIDTLTHYAYILLVVNVQSSLLLEKIYKWKDSLNTVVFCSL